MLPESQKSVSSIEWTQVFTGQYKEQQEDKNFDDDVSQENLLATNQQFQIDNQVDMFDYRSSIQENNNMSSRPINPNQVQFQYG